MQLYIKDFKENLYIKDFEKQISLVSEDYEVVLFKT